MPPPDPHNTHESAPDTQDVRAKPDEGRALGIGLIARLGLGGVLMGMANLVPGISGGTMLVATGIYTRFIDAIADVTRLRWKTRTLVTLGVVILGAVVAIGGLAGVISASLEHFRWGMYSLFIGLTLGGAPMLWRMLRPMTTRAAVGIVAGVIVMIGLVLLQTSAATGAGESGPLMLGLAGAAGASAMILPGVSGAYLLLLLGQYEPIVDAIKLFVGAAKDMDIDAAVAQLDVIIPVGIGVVVGVVVVANVLRVLLHRFEKPTLGVLLGLLVAAPAGLYPFRDGVRPEIGDTIGGEVLTADTIDEVDPKDWATRAYTPGVGRIAGSLALIVVGLGATLAIDRLGAGKDESHTRA